MVELLWLDNSIQIKGMRIDCVFLVVTSIIKRGFVKIVNTNKLGVG